MTALVAFPSSIVVPDKGPCNRKQSVPFYRSCSTSPLTDSLLLVTLAVRSDTPPLVGTVVSHLLYTLEGRQ
jgi:hypothetical protein